MMRLEDFWSGLHLEIALSRAAANDAERIAELTSKTSAFNLAAAEPDEAKLRIQLRRGDPEYWLIAARDRFDDYGVAGVLATSPREGTLVVETLLLSCRVLGKAAEYRLLGELARIAGERQCSAIELRYRRTAKNALAGEFVRKIGSDALTEDQGGFSAKLSLDAVAALAPPGPGRADGPRRARRTFSVADFVSSRWLAVPPRDRDEITLDISKMRREVQIQAALASERHRKRAAGEATYVEPRSALETVLAGIWAEVLGVERVGVHDHFFQLGGQSLLVVQIMSRLRDLFDVELKIHDVFKTPTVAALAAFMGSTDAEQARLEQKAQLLLSISELSDEDIDLVLSERQPLGDGT